ncbi:MAG: thioredoxin-dependent thiol peroxidase [Chloroflexi bacterium]|nr:thioredoxin-dependent thiol peroxidase [Chloroflexota bacterium]
MIKIGDRIPAFSLLTDDGRVVSRESLRGQRVVLYFYPKDDTPGCTVEACTFRDNLPAFDALGVPVYGISPDDARAHGRFKGKHGLNFTLLSDPDRQLIEGAGLWVEKSMYGRQYMGVQRSTLVVAPDGRVEHVWEKVKPEAHAAEVLAHLQGGEPAPAAPKPAARKKPVAGETPKSKKPAARKPVSKTPKTKQ